MNSPKPSSRLIPLTLALLLFLSFFTTGLASGSDNGDDSDYIEELIALDEEHDSKTKGGKGSDDGKPSEAEVLSKAQRIVIELNSDNNKRVVKENGFVLVLGYAPWCMRSAELMPEFADAANSLKELGSPLVMAKFDAERYPKPASSLGIKGFPTLLFFVDGTSQPYTGGFTSQDIVIWARKKTGDPVIRISSETEAKKVLKKYSTFVVGLFEKFEGSEYEEFVKAAKTDNETQFFETRTVDVAKSLFPDIKPQNLFLGLVKSEPERYTIFEGSFKKDKILQFMEYNKFPLVTIVTERNSMRVYSSTIRRQVYIFADADDFKKHLESLRDVARKFKSEIMLLYIDISEENLAKPFLTLFGLEESEDTLVAAFDNRASSKYLLEWDLTPSKLEGFCLGLLNRTLAPYYKSQPIPDNKDASIQIIVGKTFDNLVLSSPNNVILEVHTPWCLNCKATSTQMEKLAKHFKGMDNLIFARIDASANEHPKLQVDEYPTLLLYPASDKSNPLTLPTKSTTVKKLAVLINKHLKAQGDTEKDEL